ncbi:hypothetical protein FA15DRAFT_555598, partial [Coprinopsis marcescibilis]
TMTETSGKRLRVYQQKLHKSLEAQLAFINTVEDKYDILCIQEPHWDFWMTTRALRTWTVVRPSVELGEGKKYRAIIMVHKRMVTGSWERMNVESKDVVAVKVKSEGLTVFVYNIYNACEHN